MHGGSTSWIAGALLVAGPALFAADPGGVRVTATDPPEVRAWDERIETLRREGALRPERTEADVTFPGRRHQRLDQFHRGVRVEGGELVRQVGETGEALTVFGRLFEGIGIDVAPAITPDQVRDGVRARVGRDGAILSSPELVILPTGEGAFALAYAVVAGSGRGVRRYYVSARDGLPLRDVSLVQKQAAAVGRGTGVLNNDMKVSAASMGSQFVSIDVLRPARITTYDLRGNILRAAQIAFQDLPPTSADLGTDDDNTWTDGPTVDAHSYAGWTYDYFFKRFGRHGWNNSDLETEVFVNPARPSDIFIYFDQAPEFFANAFYCCGIPGLNYILFGVGAPPFTFAFAEVKSFAGSLEIVAHEWTHAVTAFSSRLSGAFCEAGGLNESFSDQMGVSVEFYQRPSTANYRLGEDVFPGGFRDMANPGAFGDPDHVSVATICEEHYLAGVPNQAFYLAIEGGRNRTSGISVQGVGAGNREQIERVFYRAFTTKLVPSSGFRDAASATIVSARELFGSNSAVERAVTQAWQAVGAIQ